MEQQVGPVRRARFVGRAVVVLLGLAVVAVGVLVVRRLTAKHPVCGPPVPNPDSTFVAADSLGKGEMLAGVLERWCLPQARINEAFCKGCGNCVAACPSGAMSHLGFSSRQTRAMLHAALHAAPVLALKE